MGHGVRITYEGLGLVLVSTTFFLGLLLKTTLKFTPRAIKVMMVVISLYWINLIHTVLYLRLLLEDSITDKIYNLGIWDYHLSNRSLKI